MPSQGSCGVRCSRLTAFVQLHLQIPATSSVAAMAMTVQDGTPQTGCNSVPRFHDLKTSGCARPASRRSLQSRISQHNQLLSTAPCEAGTPSLCDERKARKAKSLLCNATDCGPMLQHLLFSEIKLLRISRKTHRELTASRHGGRHRCSNLRLTSGALSLFGLSACALAEHCCPVATHIPGLRCQARKQPVWGTAPLTADFSCQPGVKAAHTLHGN